MSQQVKTYGQIAYEAYRAASDGVSLISGAKLPDWNDQSELIRSAWDMAAAEVLRHGRLS